jgi:hypothetical protein
MASSAVDPKRGGHRAEDVLLPRNAAFDQQMQAERGVPTSVGLEV